MIVSTNFSGRSAGKKYLSELIGEQYHEWQGKKILLTAPTGMGKTNFVMNVFLPYCRSRRRKMLILCNRKMLRLQYWQSVVEQFVRYEDIRNSVAIMTYQELAEAHKLQQNLVDILSEFETIVCDECHYFYSDSDFNGMGTYVLLQELIIACAAKTMLFMSATMEETGPLIEQTIKHTFWRLRMVECKEWLKDNMSDILQYDFTDFADFNRFHCISVPDWNSMVEIVAESSQKSLIFINNKAKGELLAEKMIKTGMVDKRDIMILNSDNIDGESDYVQNLAIGHKMLSKILITTSVLDNGVSIHDPEVGNVVIETESKIEFLQMLGRIRSESTDYCRLYFVQRDKKDYSFRMKKYEEEIKKFDDLSHDNLINNYEYYISSMWSDDARARFFRKSLVWMKTEHQVFDQETFSVVVHSRQTSFAVNKFAERKMGNMFVAEEHFYGLAVNNPLAVIYEQMKWIGKAPEELEIIESRYRKSRETEFLEKLQGINSFSAEDLGQFKKDLVKKYRKEFFDDILANNGTISNEKLQNICERYGMKLCSWEDTESRKKRYSIKEIEEHLRDE